MVSCWDSHLVKNQYQEYFLDCDCVGSLLGVVLGVIIDISMGKPDDDKVGCWLGRALGTQCSRTVFVI